eukprot:3885147-Rhodomonas_salina.2
MSSFGTIPGTRVPGGYPVPGNPRTPSSPTFNAANNREPHPGPLAKPSKFNTTASAAAHASH